MDEAPLVPAEVDLRGFGWMPYFGDYLRNSEFNALADDASYRAAHNLWWAAWHQVPCSSLPNDDGALARFADLGKDVKAWRKVKAMALHGFVKCADGRLYHRFIAKEAMKAWADKQSSEVEREKARIRLKIWRDKKDVSASHNSVGNGDETRFKTDTEPAPNTVSTVLTLPNHTVHNLLPPKAPRKRRARVLEASQQKEFDEFYAAYPIKIGVGAAEKAYLKALSLTSAESLLAGAKRFSAECQGKERQFIAHPSTWLNEKRWLDEPKSLAGGHVVPERTKPQGPPPSLHEGWDQQLKSA